MDKVTRISISLEPKLLKEFDKIIKKKDYKKRSEAIRDVIRDYIMKEKHEATIVGLIKVVYDHRINKSLRDVENEYSCLVKASMQTPIDKHKSIYVVIVKGKKHRINKFIEKIKGLGSCTFEQIE